MRLAAALGARGWRVLAIARGHHPVGLDPSTTDTHRHREEGTVEHMAMAAPDTFARVGRWSEELGPEAIAARSMAAADVVPCEGFERSAHPEVEAFREAAPPSASRLAVAADRAPSGAPDDSLAGVRLLRPDDPGSLPALVAPVEEAIIPADRRPLTPEA